MSIQGAGSESAGGLLYDTRSRLGAGALWGLLTGALAALAVGGQAALARLRAQQIAVLTRASAGVLELGAGAPALRTGERHLVLMNCAGVGCYGLTRVWALVSADHQRAACRISRILGQTPTPFCHANLLLA